MSVDLPEPDRPEHEVEIRLLGQPKVVEISADVESDITQAELLRFLADFLDADGGVMLNCSIHWSGEVDRWVLIATIDQ